jgi:hypothetical protein
VSEDGFPEPFELGAALLPGSGDDLAVGFDYDPSLSVSVRSERSFLTLGVLVRGGYANVERYPVGR